MELGAACGTRERCRKVRKGKDTTEKERIVEQAAGDECVFIPGEGPAWQMRPGSDSIPDVAGGEGGHGPLNRMP